MDGKTKSNALALESSSSKMVLADGVILFVRDFSSLVTTTRGITVDINGVKGPNRWGRDLFEFYVGKNGKNALLITGYSKTREDIKENYCNKRNGQGAYCGALIVKDGWKIKDDYPW